MRRRWKVEIHADPCTHRRRPHAVPQRRESAHRAPAGSRSRRRGLRRTGWYQALKILASDVPESKVVMLTVSEDAEDLIETLRNGASGYLLKNIDTQTLLDSIRRAAEGDSVISPQMTSKLVRNIKAGPAVAPGPLEREKLSPREREILVFLARGASNKELARALDVAESTVKIHVQHIL